MDAPRPADLAAKFAEMLRSDAWEFYYQHLKRERDKRLESVVTKRGAPFFEWARDMAFSQGEAAGLRIAAEIPGDIVKELMGGADNRAASALAPKSNKRQGVA